MYYESKIFNKIGISKNYRDADQVVHDNHRYPDQDQAAKGQQQIEQQQSQHMHTEQRCRRVEQNGQSQQEFLADDRHDEFCDFPQRGVADDRPIGLEQEKGDERIYDRAANP